MHTYTNTQHSPNVGINVNGHVHTITLPKHTLYPGSRYPHPQRWKRHPDPRDVTLPSGVEASRPPQAPQQQGGQSDSQHLFPAPPLRWLAENRGVLRPHTSLLPLKCSVAACCSKVYLKQGRAWCCCQRAAGVSTAPPENPQCLHGFKIERWAPAPEAGLNTQTVYWTPLTCPPSRPYIYIYMCVCYESVSNVDV